jgi:hypothetical protein
MGGAEDRSSAGRLAYTPRQIRNGPHADALPAERGRIDNASNGPCQPVFTSGNVQGSAIFSLSTSRR